MSFQSDQPCTACGHALENEVCEHHLFTQKVYPEFALLFWNRIPVCLRHHNEFHAQGTSHMADKYVGVYNWLTVNEWFFCKTVKKWRRDGF